MAQEWSAKEAKKAGQKFRREARSIFAEYQRNLTNKLEAVRIQIRPRPKWIPHKAWLWMAEIFVDLSLADAATEFETPDNFLARKHREAVAQQRDAVVYGGAGSTSIDDLIDDEEEVALST